MKLSIKRLLQTVLGLEGYLFVFAIFKIFTLRWDKNENDFLRFVPLVPDHTIILDIGANIGIMSVLLARHAPASTIYAFEPIPVNFKILKRVISFFRLRNVTAFPHALGDENRDVEMILPVVQGVRLQGLGLVVNKQAASDLEGDHFTVPCKRLDDLPFLQQSGKRIGAIKIDVQDFEYFVFDGARDLLAQHRPVVFCEMGAGELADKIKELFTRMDYEIRVLSDNDLVLYDPQVHLSQWNYFLLPRN